MAPKPSSAASRIVSRGKMCFSSHSAANGRDRVGGELARHLLDLELVVGKVELGHARRALACGAFSNLAGQSASPLIVALQLVDVVDASSAAALDSQRSRCRRDALSAGSAASRCGDRARLMDRA